MLEESSPSKQNAIAALTCANSDLRAKCAEPLAKRRRLYSTNDDPSYRLESAGPLSPKSTIIVPDSDAGSDDEEIHYPVKSCRTDVETALPPIDEKIVSQSYEAGDKDEVTDLDTRLDRRKWVPGRSSIYVDAFNLALDTVLEDESHLFDEAENALFQYWRDLSYEAQYL